MKIGKYEVLETIGKGGMGVVHKAYDPALEREVAVKTLSAEALSNPVMRERFYREGRAAGKLRHPNIVTIYELGEEVGVPHIVMEYLHGTDVRNIIKQRSTLALDQKIEIILQLCRGLAYAHKSAVVHRDIKPSNVFVTSEMQVKILDFGIARLLTATSVSSSGIVIGSIHYVSPEQINGAKLDGRSDIFSAGVILFELLTWKKPFSGSNTAKVLLKLTRDGPDKMDPPLDEQYPILKRVVQKSLQKDVSQRYQTAEEMAEDLEEFVRSYRQARKTSFRDGSDGNTDPRVQELLRSARRLIMEGQQKLAFAAVSQAVEINPETMEARQLMAMLQKDLQRAEIDELLREGQTFFQARDFDRAIQAFEKILNMEPDHPRARILLDAVHSELVDDMLAQAKKRYEIGQNREAFELFGDVLQLAPNNAEAQKFLDSLRQDLTRDEIKTLLNSAWRALMLEKDFDQVIEMGEKILALDAHNSEAESLIRTAEEEKRRSGME